MKIEFNLENTKKKIEGNEPKDLEDSFKDLKSYFNGLNHQTNPYKDIIESYINDILTTLFKYYYETPKKSLDEKIKETKKFLDEMKKFNNTDNFKLKFDEKDIKYYESIVYCFEAEKNKKKGDKDSYLEAYLKYREGLENGFSCDDLFNHMQIWKKICSRLLQKIYRFRK